MMNISSATTSESCVCENWNSITNPSMVSFLGFETNHHHQQQFNEWDSNPNTTITNTNTNTSYNPFSPTPNTFLPSSTFGGNGYSTISYPKLSDYSMAAEIIGLNLGRRTYFSTQESAVMDRLFKRPRGFYETAHAPRCQAEGCVIDLTHAKHYHRRHKVCEFHSKATKVIASGLEQRFCQQCSRFHVLGEFDEGKRSCRKRLADHNRRRRKPPPSKAAEKANTEAVSSSGAKSEMEKSLPSSTTCISKNLLDLEQQQLQQQQEVDMSYATAKNHQRQASSMFNDSPTMSLFERELFYSSSNEATQSMGGGGGGNGSGSDRINQHHHEDLQNLFHLGQALFDVEFSD